MSSQVVKDAIVRATAAHAQFVITVSTASNAEFIKSMNVSHAEMIKSLQATVELIDSINASTELNKSRYAELVGSINASTETINLQQNAESSRDADGTGWLGLHGYAQQPHQHASSSLRRRRIRKDAAIV